MKATSDEAGPVVAAPPPEPPIAGQSLVSLIGVSKHYADSAAVDGVDLEIHRGEFLTLLGPSGSGKTTLLRMIAGLVDPTAGEIWLDGKRINERPTYDRNIGMVFQSLALFPHLDVYGNISFPLWMRHVPKREIRRRVQEALDLVRLPQMLRRRVDELSGGQRQRVALARALVFRPSLLLLDEPLAALDQKLREEMEFELINLHHQIDVTIVNVTHDQKEALRISDRIGVMNQGRLEQVGTSVDLYRSPQTPFVALFLGNTTVIGGTIRRMDGRDYLIPDDLADVRIRVHEQLAPNTRASLVLRAEQIQLSRPGSGGEPGFQGTVTLKAFQGNTTQFEIDVVELGRKIRVESFKRSDALEFSIGDAVQIGWSLDDIHLIPASERAQ